MTSGGGVGGVVAEGSRDPRLSRDVCRRGDPEGRVELRPGRFEVVLCADVTEGSGWVTAQWGGTRPRGATHISMERPTVLRGNPWPYRATHSPMGRPTALRGNPLPNGVTYGPMGRPTAVWGD